jgi:aminoglycoside phosphotransferase (APT) family kinase protein
VTTGTAAVRRGNTVRRPAGPWTPAVHSLLRHFEVVGFAGAPRALGVDGKEEVLSWVEGETPAAGAAPAADEVVAAIGELLRTMHDAQTGFVRDDAQAWQALPGRIPGDEVICHNDPLGSNTIFRGGRPVALVDWELAAPGRRLADVAAAAMWWAPLRPTAAARGHGLPTDRRGPRLRLLADAYGLHRDDRVELPDLAIALARGWHEAYRVLGHVERRQPWASRWDAGRGAAISEHVHWLEAHRAELLRWLR